MLAAARFLVVARRSSVLHEGIARSALVLPPILACLLRSSLGDTAARGVQEDAHIGREQTLYEQLVARPFSPVDDRQQPSFVREQCLASHAPRDLAPSFRRLEEAGTPECAPLLAEFYCERMARLADPAAGDFPRGCEEGPGSARRAGLPNATRLVAAGAPSRIAFFFLVSWNGAVAARALRALYDAAHTFAVHVDPRYPEVLQTLKGFAKAEGLSEVRFFSEVPVHRGGPSMLRAELFGLEKLLAWSQSWEYFVYLSDSDYPLATPAELGHFLRLLWPMSLAPVVYAFDEVRRARHGRWMVVGRSDLGLRAAASRRLVLECGGRALAVQPELDYPVAGGQVQGTGSFSVALERGFAEWLTAEVRVPGSLVRRIYDEETSLGQPDETFFQAILLNTQWCNRHVHSTLHFSWVDSHASPSYAVNDSDISSLSPMVLTADSVQGATVRAMLGTTGLELPNSTDGLTLHRSYAMRKVRFPESAALLDEVDAALAAARHPTWRAVRPKEARRLLKHLAWGWLAAHDRKVGAWSVAGVEERLGPGGTLVARFTLRRSAETVFLEAHERLALPAAAPTSSHRLLGRVLLMRVVAEATISDGGATCGIASMLPARAHGLTLVAQMSPLPEACELSVRWFDPRGAVRATSTLVLRPWQTVIQASYSSRRGPTRVGEWRVQLAQAGACRAFEGTTADRTFYIFGWAGEGESGVEQEGKSAAKSRVNAAALDRYFDFTWQAPKEGE